MNKSIVPKRLVKISSAPPTWIEFDIDTPQDEIDRRVENFKKRAKIR